MCLSIPAKILSIKGDMATASVNGVLLEISLQLVENAKAGDFVLVHTGYALQILSDEDAVEAGRIYKKLQNPNLGG